MSVTKEEIQRRIAEIDTEIEALDSKKRKLSTVQLAIKLIINSIYGAFGNPYFYFSNVEIAASITTQGQDLIKYSIAAVNHYFRNIWHKDTVTHKALGINTNDIEPVAEDCAVYADTDSTYVNFDPMIRSVRGLGLNKKEQSEFCVKFVDVRFASYLDDAFDRYSKSCNTENQQEFKLETISDAGLWIGKKNYMLRVVYDGEAGLWLDEPYLKVTGVDAAKPSFPAYARDKMKIILNKIMDDGQGIDIEGYVIPKLMSFRKGFYQLPVDECCKNMNISKYNDWVDTDKELVIKDKMPIGARSALYHNYLIEKNNARKYNKIRQGNKVKVYKAEDKRPGYEGMDIFSYHPGQYPAEFAPDMDKNEQFHFVVVEPINKALNAMGLQSIDVDMKREVAFERIKVKRELKEEEMYPMWCVNLENLEYEEIPRDVGEYINGGRGELPQDRFPVYLDYVSKWGINTKIVPNRELDGLIAREKKKKWKDRLKEADVTTIKEMRAGNLADLNKVRDDLQSLEARLKVAKEENKNVDKKDTERQLMTASKVNDLKDALKPVKKDIKFHESLEQLCIEKAREMNRERVKASA